MEHVCFSASSASQDLPLIPVWSTRIPSTLRGIGFIYHCSLGFSQKQGKTRQHKQSEVRSRGGVNLLITGSSCLGWEHLLCIGAAPLFFQNRPKGWPNPPLFCLLQCVQAPENAESRWLQPQGQESLEGKAWQTVNSHPKSVQKAALPTDTSGPLLLQ